jgi:hypothetical protein
MLLNTVQFILQCTGYFMLLYSKFHVTVYSTFCYCTQYTSYYCTQDISCYYRVHFTLLCTAHFMLLYTVHFILLYTVNFILLCTGHCSTFHITVYTIFATYLHFVPVFWALYLSITPICRKYEGLNSSFITIIITGLSETPWPLQLFKCNYQPMQCVTSHHQNWPSNVSHYPWVHSPSKYDIGIKQNFTFSWQKLWGLSVIWEVMQFSLAVRYQSFAKTCCLWLHLGDDNSRFLQNTGSQPPNHTSTYPRTQ